MSVALEHDAAGGRLQHAQDREPGGGLAASALADQAERLAALQREADAVDGLHGADAALDTDAAREREVHAQILDAQDFVRPCRGVWMRRAQRRR